MCLSVPDIQISTGAVSASRRNRDSLSLTASSPLFSVCNIMRDFGKTKHIATRILDWTDGQRNVDPFSCFCNPSCERSCALSSIMGSTMLERDGKVLAVTGAGSPVRCQITPCPVSRFWFRSGIKDCARANLSKAHRASAGCP